MCFLVSNVIEPRQNLDNIQNHNKLSDEDLVCAIVSSNDTMLFEILYDRYSKVVFNKCYSFARNQYEAEDLTQDVFLKLFVKLRSFKGNSKFSTWLYAFTYNHCVNYVNRNTAKKIQRKSVDSEVLETRLYDPQIDDQDITQLRVGKLKDALEEVSADEKMILAVAWEPYQEVFQGVITCIHNDFRIGGLKPGETKVIRGKMYLVPADEKSLLSRFRKDFP